MSGTKVRYIGLDLAWSERTSSGVCVLDGSGTVLAEDAVEPAQLANWATAWRGDYSVLAIDGPLVVPRDGQVLRPVERRLHHLYGALHAGPYPGGSGSLFLKRLDVSPAMALVNRVGGYETDPFAYSASHRAIEVFPAPTWIEVFGLTRRLVYKRGLKSERVLALEQIQSYLTQLASRDHCLRIDQVDRVAELWPHARTLSAYKRIEDILDARLCAYVALLWDSVRDPAWVITGDAPGPDRSRAWRSGYVVVPQFRPHICSYCQTTASP